MALDWCKKWISSQEKSEKDKYLTGIQIKPGKDFGDYTAEDSIKYTCSVISKKFAQFNVVKP